MAAPSEWVSPCPCATSQAQRTRGLPAPQGCGAELSAADGLLAATCTEGGSSGVSAGPIPVLSACLPALSFL